MIGILLLCNEHGIPLRWCTLPGHTQDREALRDLVGAIEEREWVQNVPIVFDRAMGSAGAVARLWSSKLRFLTAVPRPEIHRLRTGLSLQVSPSSTLLTGTAARIRRSEMRLSPPLDRTRLGAHVHRAIESTDDLT